MNDRHHPTRREFLMTGAAGLAGAAFLGSAGGCSRSEENREGARKFVYRTLGRTGLRVPVVGMGAIYAPNLVRAALEEGVAYLHTSSGYAERNHERMLGSILPSRPRNSFVITSSPDLPYEYIRSRGRSSDLGLSADPEMILGSIEGTLERLGLEFVDVYNLLSVGRRETVLHEPYLRALEKLKRDGKIRFAGIGTHENEPEVIRAAVESGFYDVVLTAYNFRQTHREEIREAIGEAAGAGLGVVAMKTQAGVYWDQTRTRKINMQAALKWVLRDENVHTTIPAFSNYDEMYEDLAVMENLGLTPEERADLRMGDDLGCTGNFCQQCGGCLAQCPEGMDVRALMRGSMYAFGHQEPKKARETLRSWTPEDVLCLSCDACAVECALGLDVKSRALGMARLLELPVEFPG
ncbi:MAG: aldo/keto reductase [Candidatus Eisenbacteria bacterium]